MALTDAPADLSSRLVYSVTRPDLRPTWGGAAWRAWYAPLTQRGVGVPFFFIYDIGVLWATLGEKISAFRRGQVSGDERTQKHYHAYGDLLRERLLGSHAILDIVARVQQVGGGRSEAADAARLRAALAFIECVLAHLPPELREASGGGSDARQWLGQLMDHYGPARRDSLFRLSPLEQQAVIEAASAPPAPTLAQHPLPQERRDLDVGLLERVLTHYHLRRLAPTVSAWQEFRQRSTFDVATPSRLPEGGYTGLTRRGHLSSLRRHELGRPDFVQRVVNHQAMFYAHPAPRLEQQRLLLAVLVDVGPRMGQVVAGEGAVNRLARELASYLVEDTLRWLGGRGGLHLDIYVRLVGDAGQPHAPSPPAPPGRRLLPDEGQFFVASDLAMLPDVPLVLAYPVVPVGYFGAFGVACRAPVTPVWTCEGGVDPHAALAWSLAAPGPEAQVGVTLVSSHHEPLQLEIVPVDVFGQPDTTRRQSQIVSPSPHPSTIPLPAGETRWTLRGLSERRAHFSLRLDHLPASTRLRLAAGAHLVAALDRLAVWTEARVEDLALQANADLRYDGVHLALLSHRDSLTTATASLDHLTQRLTQFAHHTLLNTFHWDDNAIVWRQPQPSEALRPGAASDVVERVALTQDRHPLQSLRFHFLAQLMRRLTIK